MYELKMMNGDIYEITEEEAFNLATATGLVLIKRLNLRLNFSSLVSIAPKGLAKTKQSNNKKVCRDGSIAIKEFGVWKDARTKAIMDLSYYPELLESDEEEVAKLPSGYAKELSSKINNL